MKTLTYSPLAVVVAFVVAGVIVTNLYFCYSFFLSFNSTESTCYHHHRVYYYLCNSLSLLSLYPCFSHAQWVTWSRKLPFNSHTQCFFYLLLLCFFIIVVVVYRLSTSRL